MNINNHKMQTNVSLCTSVQNVTESLLKVKQLVDTCVMRMMLINAPNHLQCQRYLSKICPVKKTCTCKTCSSPNSRLFFLDSISRNSECSWESTCEWNTSGGWSIFTRLWTGFDTMKVEWFVLLDNFISRSSIFNYLNLFCNAVPYIYPFF